MGYAFEELTQESLLEFLEEEYADINWDKKFIENDDEYIAIWGWDDDGTYSVALALPYERTDEEVEEYHHIYGRELSKEERILLKRGWNVKVLNEAEGPVIQPSAAFLKSRPPMTIQGKRAQKDAENLRETTEILQALFSDKDNEGIIMSAQACGEGQTFICTTKGNYYLPESEYDPLEAMFGMLTVQSLKENNIPMIPTIEKRPHTP